MDKQKQIEEMAKIIDEDCGDCHKCKYEEIKTPVECFYLLYAERLYNAGYRKIPENAVVLTREEYYEFGKRENYLSDQLDLCYLQLKDMGLVRKETAEKFAKMAKERSFDEYSPDGRSYECVAVSDIDEICKEIVGG